MIIPVVFVRAITEALILAVQTRKRFEKGNSPSPTSNADGGQSHKLPLAAKRFPDYGRPLSRRRLMAFDAEGDGGLGLHQVLDASMNGATTTNRLSVVKNITNQALCVNLETTENEIVQSEAVGAQCVEEPRR